MQQRKTRILILFCVYFLFSIFGFLLTEREKEVQIQSVFDKHLLYLQTNYGIFINNCKKTGDLIYNDIISHKEMMEIFKKVSRTQDPKELFELRNNLYNYLLSHYKNYQKADVLQLHFFHLDNRSFLRMHKPDKFGDDLSAIREDVVLVNQNKKPVHGFVQGRVAHGFRNTYPVFDENGVHVITMEASFDSTLLQKYFLESNQIRSDFLIEEELYKSKIWDQKTMITACEKSRFYPGYMIVCGHTHEDLFLDVPDLAKKKEIIQANLGKKKKFTIFFQENDTTRLLSFYPVSHAVSGKSVAWIVTYEKEVLIQEIYRNTLILRIIFFLVLLLSFFLIKNLYYSLWERKKIEKELRASELRWKFAIEGNGDGLWDWNLKTNEIYFSSQWKKMLGFSDHEIEGNLDEWKKRVHPEDLPKMYEDIQNHLENKTGHYHNEHRILCKNGTYKWVLDRGFIVESDENHKPLRMIGTHTDIDEQIYFRTTLEKLTKNLNEAQKLASLGSWTLDHVSGELQWSDEIFRIFEIQKENFGACYEYFLSVIHPEDAEFVHQAFESSVRDKTFYDITHRLLLKNGKIKNVRERGCTEYSADGNPLISSGTVQDVTREKLLEEEVLRERNFVSAIIENANAVIAVICADGTMTRINRYGENITGYTKEQIASEPFFWKRFLPLSIRDKVLDIFAEARKGRMATGFQNAWISRYGEPRMFEWSNTLLTKEDGSFDCIYTIGIDITESERIKKEMEAVFKTSKDGLAILDLQTNFLKCNQAYAQMLGYSREELLQKSCKGLSHEEDMPRLKAALLEVFEKGFITNFEKRCLTKSGGVVNVNMAISMMPDGQKILVSVKDITEMKEIQKDLIFAKEEAEKASRAKSDFLANVSHEIRTPLNGVIGLTELCLQTHLDLVQRNYLQTAKSSAKALLQILNDVLDYSKIEAGKLSLENRQFSLDSVMKTIQNLFDYQVIQKKINFIIDFPKEICLYGDSLRLTQVLANLVGNALKFTHFGEVSVRCRVLEDQNDQMLLEFIVKDTGIGMSEEVQKNLFQEFSQADESITRTYGGTGLGLAICKKIILMMEGEIFVSSQKDLGSEFVVKVAFQRANCKDLEVNSSLVSDSFLPIPLKNARVLLVEDNLVNQMVATEMLKSFSLEVFIANHGQEALQMIQNQDFDLVLMDLQMPVMDGFEASLAIRKFNSQTPIIALSAAVMKEDREKTQAAGMNDHIAKPLTLANLARVLQEFLGHSVSDHPARNNPGIPQLYGIEMTEFLKRVGDQDTDWIKALIDSFCRQYRDFDLSSLVSLDVDLLRKKIHSLKGTSSTLAMHEIRNLCLKIEENPKDESQIFLLENRLKATVFYLENQIRDFF